MLFARLIARIAPLLFIATNALAQGGPPLRTDDPGTPGKNNWEINFGVATEQSASRRDYELPITDFNYGLGNSIQLKYEIPFVVSNTDANGTSVGIGYSLIGVKWRFIDEDKSGIAVSIYPQVSFNSPIAPADRQNQQGTQFLMPVEVLKTIRPFTIFGETEYDFVQGKVGQWLYALAAGYNVTQNVELLGEAHGLVRANFNDDELIINAGARVKLTKNLLLQFSAGHSVRNFNDEQSKFVMYVGVRYFP